MIGARAVIKRLDGLLSPLGFERHSRTWNRSSGHYLDVVDVQQSRARDSITLNVGVMDPEIYRLCWQSDPKEPVEEPSCIVRSRVGSLMGDTDVWWPLDAPATDDEVAAAVTAHALPFFEGMHDHSAMAGFLETSGALRQRYPPPIIYFAILKQKLGDHRTACATLEELAEKALGEWPSRVRAVADAIGCPRAV